jgi:hypothetical protein
MIRLIVEDVTLVRDRARIRVHVRFRGGKTESLEVTPPPKSWQKRLTTPEAVAEVDKLLDEHTLDEIAEIRQITDADVHDLVRKIRNRVLRLLRKTGKWNDIDDADQDTPTLFDTLRAAAILGRTRARTRRWPTRSSHRARVSDGR